MELNFDKYSARELLDMYIKEANRIPPSQAEYLLKRAIEKDPFYEEPYIHLSKIYQKLGKTNKAIETLNTLKMLNPYRSYPYLNLAKIFSDQGDIEKAVAILKEGIKKFEEVNLSFEFTIDLYSLAIKYSIYNWKDEEAEELIHEAYEKYKNNLNVFKRIYPFIEELGLYEVIFQWINHLTKEFSFENLPIDILEAYANACFEIERDEEALKVYEYLKNYLEYPFRKIETDITLKLRFDYGELFLNLGEEKKVEKLMKAILELNTFGDYALAALEVLKSLYTTKDQVLKFLKVLEEKVFGKYNLNSYYIELILEAIDEAYKKGYKKEVLKAFGGLLASTVSYESRNFIESQINRYFKGKEKYLIELYKLHFEGSLRVEE